MEKMAMTLAYRGEIHMLDTCPDLREIERTGFMLWNGKLRNVIDVHRQWAYVDGKISHMKGFQIELDDSWNDAYQNTANFAFGLTPKIGKEAVHA